MPGFTYGEWRLIAFAVFAVFAAFAALSAGEGVGAFLGLLAVAGVIFFLAWRHANR